MSFLVTAAALVPGCGGEDNPTPPERVTCSGEGGPVEDGAEDTSCIDDAGKPIVQVIGECVQGSQAGTSGTGGAGGAGSEGGAGGAGGDQHDEAGEHEDDPHEDEEHEDEHPVRSSNHAADDDCKYDVSFTNSCVEVNKPVTFMLTLSERASGNPAVGGKPSNPEVFLADNPSHISPSQNIKAPESPAGTYAVGPILFDRSGRWVVRFHYFETCSDVEEDSPHGHVAFYIDVP
jgi:hypothetical protein